MIQVRVLCCRFAWLRGEVAVIVGSGITTSGEGGLGVGLQAKHAGPAREGIYAGTRFAAYMLVCVLLTHSVKRVCRLWCVAGLCFGFYWTGFLSCCSAWH